MRRERNFATLEYLGFVFTTGVYNYGMLIKDFLEFLREYKVVSVALAFVMATASTALMNSFVKDILLPVASPLFSVASLHEAIFSLGPIHIAYGSFLAELLDFIFLGFVVFLIAKKIFKQDHAEKQ